MKARRIGIALITIFLIGETPLKQAEKGQETPSTATDYSIGEWERLQLAIALTESRLDPTMIGEADDWGLLQIRPIYVEEVNRVAGTDYTHEDAFDIDKSLEMFALMQEHYNPGRDIETALRYHNKADWYRKKVLANLELINRYEEIRTKLIEK